MRQGNRHTHTCSSVDEHPRLSLAHTRQCGVIGVHLAHIVWAYLLVQTRLHDTGLVPRQRVQVRAGTNVARRGEVDVIWLLTPSTGVLGPSCALDSTDASAVVNNAPVVRG